VKSTEISVGTGARRGVFDLTAECARFVADEGDGLLNVFVPHATAGVVVMELGAGSDDDLVAALDTLLPRDDRWRHRHGSRGHGADHVVPLLVPPSVSIPVIGGRLGLGTWQSIALLDPNGDNDVRTVRLSFVDGQVSNTGQLGSIHINGTRGNQHELTIDGSSNVNTFQIKKGDHIVASRIEHPAVIEVCRYLETLGFTISYLHVNSDGLVDPATVAAAITSATSLITIMHANNETGAIQPVEEIAALARRHGITLHTDAAQSIGKIPADVRTLNVDLLSIAGHKLYAPKGIGALYIRAGVTLEKFMHGAGHESGFRAGTENVAQIVALGAACEMANADTDATYHHLRRMRDRLLEGLRARLERRPGLRLYTPIHSALPNTLNLSFNGVRATDLMTRLEKEIACSAGSACHADSFSLSPVLSAMGIPEQDILGALRFSTGRMTTAAEIDTAIACITRAVEEMNGMDAG